MRARHRLLVVALLAAVAAAPPPADARRPRPIKLRVPRFVVPPASDREVCTFVRVPMKKSYDVAGQVIVSAGGRESRGSTSHHFLIWAYVGKDLAGFKPLEGKVVDSKACLDFGPADGTSRVLVGGVQTPRSATKLPRGLALRIDPAVGKSGEPEAIGFILNSHWINGSSRPVRGGVRVKLLPAKPGTVKRLVKPIFEIVANGFIAVAPGEIRSAGWSWGPGRPDLARGLGGVEVPQRPACVTTVTGHMHKWGTLFTADFVDASGVRTRVFDATEYADPGQRRFDPPLLMRPGERIDYACTHDNGVTRPVKLGCEEEPGRPPGVSAAESLLSGRGPSGAAKHCTRLGPDAEECPPTDPAYRGRTFTGNCVEARLVFGFTSRDEMCILPGSYYDADATAVPGHECDL